MSAGQGHDAAVWAQPTDTGLEFGATFPDALGSSTLEFAMDLPAGVSARLEADNSIILERVMADVSGVTRSELAGRISAPLVRESGDQVGDVTVAKRVKVDLLAQGVGTYHLQYAIDPAWFHAPERVFPVVLDPTICLRPGGGTGCTTNSGYLNTFIASGKATTYPNAPISSLRVGYDVQPSPDDVWGQMRSLLAFDQATLSDGWQVTNASLVLKEDNNRDGSSAPRIIATLLSKDLSSTSTWNSMNTRTVAGYTSLPVTGVAPCSTGGTDCDVTLDVTAIVAATHSKNGATWKAGYGFMLQQVAENSTLGEVDFFTGDAQTPVGSRPRLAITYVTPSVGFDFDPALGPTYSPSTMVKGVPTILPVVVENKTGSGNILDKCTGTSDADCYELGYRWFNAKGKLVSSTSWGTVDLLANVPVGAKAAGPVGLKVTPPSTVGQYSLRLDLVHRMGGSTGTRIWASDFADPSKYNARKKKVLTPDSTRWVGGSVIEKAEFGITVGSGDLAGDRRGSGGLGIDLATRNLSYEGGTGLGFADLLPMDLGYGYNSVDVTDCTAYQGILGACGWSTSWDERISGGQTATGYDYTYQGPDGSRSLVDTDGAGQLVSGAPVLLERERFTFADEVKPPSAGATVVDAAGAGFPVFYGTRAVRTAAGTSTGLGSISSTNLVNLNAYPRVSFAMRTSASGGAASAGLCLKIHNTSPHVDPDAYPDRWFCYTTGTTWTTGFSQVNLGLQSGVASLSSGWNYYSRDLFSDITGVSGNPFGADTDDYEVISVQIQSAGANGNYTYLDAARFEPADSVIVNPDGAPPDWTSGDGLVSTSGDHLDGSQSLKVAAATYASSPMCDTTGAACWSTIAGATWVRPFASWAWKKVGGETAAVSFSFKDYNTGVAKGSITYYAGAVAPAGAPNCPGTTTPCVIQVSPTLPTTWTRVTRNFREDARQVLGIYTDTSTKSRPAGPDDVRMTGYRIIAGDGNFLLLSAIRYTSLPSTALSTRTGATDEWGLPGTTGSSAFTYDYRATYPDGVVHFFNERGLLERITDLDDNSLNLDWTLSTTLSGQDAYTLSRIRAAADGKALSTGIADREIVMTRTVSSPYNVLRFAEVLGSTTSDLSTRAATFYVGNTTGTTFGVGDLVKVAPARVVDQACGATPSGCSEFDYTDATNHRLFEVRDPRNTGASGSGANYRLAITWSNAQAAAGGANPAGDTSTNPVAIKDRAASSAALFNVVRWDNAPSGSLYRRPLSQDSAALAAGAYATHTELSPDGAVRAGHVVQPCGTSCATNPPASDTTTLSALRSSTSEFDGLAQVSKTTTYRCNQTGGSGCTGSTDLVSVTRQGSNAGARVDNYVNPLAAGGPAWTQSADQSFASLRDSGGTNPDLYRTEYTYDGYGQPIDTVAPVLDGVTGYASAIRSTYFRYAHYRLGGNVTDEAGANPGSANAITYDNGALARDANQAAVFNGTTSRVTSTATIPGYGYTLEAWVKVTVAGQTGKGIVADWASSSGGLLYLNGSGAFALVHNATYVHSSVVPVAGRWYHVAATWDGSLGKVYVDGALVASGPATGSPGAGGTSLEIGSYGNGTASTCIAGSIDEAAVFTQALDDNRVRAHYLAGRGIADRHSVAIYDREGHVTADSDQFLANPGFESGLSSWQNGGGAAPYFSTAPATDANVHYDPGAPTPSYASLNTTGQANVNQDLVLLPGQTFRLQFWAKAASGGAEASHGVSYWNTDSDAWATLLHSEPSPSVWTQYAYDLSIPINSDGRVRVGLWNGAGVGTSYFDDVVVVTEWSSTTFNAAGQPTDTYALASAGSIHDTTVYAASPAHPAIFATKTTANYLNGGYDDAVRDEDVATSTTYDTWGRTQVTTDPDGRPSPTPAFAPNQTDIATSTDALGNVTSYAYDIAGRLEQTTSPMGSVTSATYNRAGQVVTQTAPDDTVTKTTYNNYGQATAITANYVNGTPSGTTGTDDVITTTTYDPLGRTTRTDADCGAPGACTTNGGIDAVAEQTYDLAGNAVATTIWPGAGRTGTARTTTSYFETFTYTPAGGSAITLTRTSPSGTRAAVAPASAPAPVCPGTGPGTPVTTAAYCTTASIARVLGGVVVPGVDMNGTAALATDAYGNTSRTWSDFAGHPVRTVVNYDDGVYADTDRDRDLISDTIYTIDGRPRETIDPANRGTSTTYDRLGRVIKTTTLDSNRAPVLDTRSVYLPSGRLDRISSAADARSGHETEADADRTWTRTLYDIAGRATRTVSHASIAANPPATLAYATFEADKDNWNKSSSGWFTAGVAATSETTADQAASGSRSLAVTLNATDGYAGAWWDLSGRTYTTGHTYNARFKVRMPTGVVYDAFLGRDVSGGGNQGGLQNMTGTGGWQTVTISWLAGPTLTSPVHFAIRRPTPAAAMTFYVDDVIVWDATAGGDTDIVTAETGYDPDGRVAASVLPPGNPATDEPLATITSYDRVGRVVAVRTSARPTYAAVVKSEPSPVGHWRLDEPSGTSAADAINARAMTISGGVTLGAAPGIDERPSASMTFDGASGKLQVPFNKTTWGLTGATISLEAWFRTSRTTGKGDIIRNSHYGLGFWLAQNGAVMEAVIYGAAQGRLTTAGYQDNAWHHMVATADGTTMRLYMDGALAGTTPLTGTLNLWNDNVAVGAIDSGGEYFAGGIDEVAVYASALSADQVLTHFAGGRSIDRNLQTTYGYDALANRTSATDPTGIVTMLGYDRLGRVTSTIENYLDGSVSGSTADDDVKSTFAYDAVGEMLAYCPARAVANTDACDPNSTDTASAKYRSAWHYAYDAMGRQTKTAPPVNVTAAQQNTSETVYEAGGRVAMTCTYPAGSSCAGTTNTRTATPAYDTLGRTLTSTIRENGTVRMTTTITYARDGQVQSTSDGSDTLTNGYDTSGRPTTISRAGVALTAYAYSATDGTVTSRTDRYADGTTGTTGYGYDWANRQKTASAPAIATGTVTQTWRLDGLLATKTYPTTPGETLTISYDAAKRPTTITRANGDHLDRTYDRAGNVTSDSRSLAGITGDAGSGTQAFTYDGLGRLTESTGLAVAKQYTYDLDGNRVHKTEDGVGTAYTFDRTDMLVDQTTTVTTTFVYDAFGNMTRKAESPATQTVMTYDAANRLTAITPASGTSATFTLDALGRFATRVLEDPASTDTYAYLGAGETVAEISNPTAGTIRSMLDVDGSRLATRAGAATATFTLFDALGSLIGLVGSTRTITEATRFDGYGESVGHYGATSSPWRFRGHLDISPGASPLYDMGARFYAPSIGAFTQMDTVAGSAQDPLSMNRFLYAQGNPATLIDPTGHCARFMDGVCADARTSESPNAAKTRLKRQQEQNSRRRESDYERGRGTYRSVGNRKVSSVPSKAALLIMAVKAAVDGARKYSPAETIKLDRAEGKAYEIRAVDEYIRNTDPLRFEKEALVRDETLKYPATGKSISAKRPDLTWIDKETSNPTEVIDFYSARTPERAARVEGIKVGKYGVDLAKIGLKDSVPVTTIGEVRGPRVERGIPGLRIAGSAFGIVALIDIIVTGGGDWSFLTNVPCTPAADGYCHA